MAGKVCATRRSKRLPSVYLRKDLIELAQKNGIPLSETRNLKKEKLCELLDIKWTVPPPQPPRKAKIPKGGLLFFEGKPCNTVRSKLRPNSLTKKDLVGLAINRLNYSESAANRATKAKLCEALNNKTAKSPQIKNCISRSKMELNIHQQQLVQYLHTHRGAVAAHSVGSGKTLTAVVASQCFLDEHPNWNVIVVTPTSLQENFKKELENYGANPEDKRYTFLTLGTFSNTYKDKGCSRNTFLIIDEAHNLRTDIKAAKLASTAKALKTKSEKLPGLPRAEIAVNCAKNVDKVLLLTATPIYNNPMDVVNLAAMVKGEDPLTKNEFKKLIDENPGEFNRYFECVFSFYDKQKSADYPSVTERTIKIIMTPEYYKKYRQVEQKNSHLFNNNTDPWKFLTGIRQATNALDPCQKCEWAVKKILEKKKTVLYSAFKTYGVEKIQMMLEKTGVDFVEVTGDMSKSERNKAVTAFNAEGGPDVLFITKAGSEGLDLKGVRNVILLESGWNRPGEEQIIGRAARYKSHEHLPREERKVNVYHLIIIKPSGGIREPNDRIGSADEFLKQRVGEKMDKNELFSKRIRAISIEKKGTC